MKNDLPGQLSIPLLAALIAIAITTIMDFTGLTAFSALPLLAITLAFWFILKLSQREMGLVLGSLDDYAIALLYPAIVIGATVLVSFLFGEISTENTDWNKTMTRVGLASSIGIIMVMLTEEGFFRGLLWGAFSKKGVTPHQTLWLTSIIFTIWHISAVTSGTEYGLPLQRVPIYLINATLLGLIWGLMRLRSGSIIVPSVSHAVWNGIVYEWFAFGEKVGALGMENTIWFGPEVGLLGIVLNGAFFFWLYQNVRNKGLLEKKAVSNS